MQGHPAGRKFYTWLESWHWDLSTVDSKPQDVCLQRWYDQGGHVGADVTVDACACDAIVTDCHAQATSAGAGDPETSAPFNVFNSAGAYDPPSAPANRKEWWNAASDDYAWRHEYTPSLLKI